MSPTEIAGDVSAKETRGWVPSEWKSIWIMKGQSKSSAFIVLLSSLSGAAALKRRPEWQCQSRRNPKREIEEPLNVLMYLPYQGAIFVCRPFPGPGGSLQDVMGFLLQGLAEIARSCK